jgi:hypothetical protein
VYRVTGVVKEFQWTNPHSWVQVMVASMALGQTQSKPPESPLKGYVAPPPIPGYEPNNDPRDFTGVWRNVPLPGALRFALAAGIKLNERAAAQNAATLARMKASKATSIATPHVTRS